MEDYMWFANIGAVLTSLLSLLAIFLPSKIESFVSIQRIGNEGRSEIQATYGGFFLAIAGLALLSQNPIVFVSLGFGWLGAAVVRLVTLFLGSYSPKNVGGVVFESVVGLLCISPSLLA